MIARSQIPRGWRWVNSISPQTYIIYGITVSQLADNNAEVANTAFLNNRGNSNLTVSQYINDIFEYESGFEWYCVGILLIYITIFRFELIFFKC